MSRFGRLGFVVGVTALMVATASTAVAAKQTPQVARRATNGTLVVHITTTSGTVWGKVTVSPGNKTCSKATCTFKVKVGTKLTLKETPTNAATWPFNKWSLNKNASAGTGTTLKFKMAKSDIVTAGYVLKGGTLTVNITDTGTVWGTVSIPSVGSCSQAKCVFKNVPLGQSLTLTETPTNASTWPFSGWTLNGNNAGTSTTLNFNMGSVDTVTANYVLAG